LAFVLGMLRHDRTQATSLMNSKPHDGQNRQMRSMSETGRHSSLCTCATLLVSLCLTAGQFNAAPARANEIGRSIKNAGSDVSAAPDVYRAVSGDESKLVVVPLPIVDPTIGNGAALTALYTFGTSDDPSTPRSTIGLAAGYTDSETWAIGAGANWHISNDRYRLSSAGGYGEFNLKYFGTGNDSIFKDNPINFSATGYFVNFNAQARVRKSLYVGMTFRHLEADVSTRIPIDPLPNLTTPFTLTGIGPTIEYDSRDSSWWPTSGSLVQAELLSYEDTARILSFDVTETFTTVDLSAAHYWEPTGGVVVAGQGGASYARGDVPFFMNPFVSIRGFPAGKYLDSAVAQVQGEVRWNAWNKLGLVAFAGVGVTGSKIGRFDNTAYGFGGGVRYRISEVDKMNIGFDVATDGTEPVVYFRIGEAF
jgi:hypothetical protein